LLKLCVLGWCAAGVTAPARAATQVVQVNASVLKPLLLTWVQDLDLGTISLGPGTWTGGTVSISKTGVFSCANIHLTCTGATKVAIYNVQGSKQSAVAITAPNVTLINQADATKTLTLTVDKPATITLANNGFPGSDFWLGGSITLSSTTATGTYVGTFNVTVDYQ
jgi:hypothetical protein